MSRDWDDVDDGNHSAERFAPFALIVMFCFEDAADMIRFKNEAARSAPDTGLVN